MEAPLTVFGVEDLADPLTTFGDDRELPASAGLGSVATARMAPFRLRVLIIGGNGRRRPAVPLPEEEARTAPRGGSAWWMGSIPQLTS